MNYFSVMYQKKLKKDGEEAQDGDEEITKKKGSASNCKLLLGGICMVSCWQC